MCNLVCWAVDALGWDAGNLAHLRPGITRDELDAMYDAGRYECFGEWYVDDRGVETWQERLVGRTPAGRYLTIACDVLDDGRYRPITVWASSPSEVRAYRRLHPDD